MKKKTNTKIASLSKKYAIETHMSQLHGEHVKKLISAKVYPYGPTRSAADALVAHVRCQMDNGAERVCVQMMSTYCVQSPKPIDIGGVIAKLIVAPKDDNDKIPYTYEFNMACLFWEASSDKTGRYRVCYTYVPRESKNNPNTAVEEANDSGSHFAETLEMLRLIFGSAYIVEKYEYQYQSITITKPGSTAMFLHEEIYKRCGNQN
jgi:hypothetical protein